MISKKRLSKLSLFFIFLSLLFLSFQISAEVVVQTTDNETQYLFQVEGVDLSFKDANQKRFIKAVLKGVEGHEGIIYELGRPEIPVVRLMVIAENDADISVLFSEDEKDSTQEVAINYPLYPSQESLPKILGSKIKFMMSSSAYVEDNYIPENDYTIEDGGSVMGKTQKIITIYPFRYRPSTNEYVLVKNFSVTVNNQEQVLAREDYKNDVFAFVVGEKYKNNQKLKEYMDFKRGLGYKIEIIIAEQNRTTPADIRQRLQDILKRTNDSLKYALLIVDIEDVPSKTAKNISGVTDHYYRAIDTNDYESDINGPDIGVGRLTVKNDSELNLVVDKLLRYQIGNFSNQDWLKQISFVATDDRYQVAEGSHNYVINTYTKNRGYTGIFPKDNMPGGDQLYAITHRVKDATVVDAMRQGRTIIDYSGHGSTTSWAGPNVSQQDIRSFNNKDALPFVIGNACVTGQFTITESMGETWIKHPYGAILYWGSMDSSYWDEDDILEKNMFDSIYRDNKTDFSSITNQGLSAVWKYYGGANRSKYYWETYVIFGDPSINLRTAPTENIIISSEDSIVYGTTEFELSLGNKMGRAISNIRIGAELPGKDFIWHGQTDVSGKVIVKVPAEAIVGDKLKITVYGQDMKLLTKEVELIAGAEPFLLVTKMTVANREALDVFPHERASLFFAIKNVSQSPAKQIALMISKINGPAKSLNNRVTIPSLAYNESYSWNSADFGFVVDNARDGEEIEVTFEWTAEKKYAGSFKRKFKVLRGELAIEKIDFGTPDNQIEGSMGPGDIGKLFLTVTNKGSLPINKGDFSLLKSFCVLDISSDHFSIEKLMPGQSLRITTPISVHVDSACSNDGTANFLVNGFQMGTVAREDVSTAGKFVIGKIVNFTREDKNLNVPIRDKETISHRFVVDSVGTIKDISLYVNIAHSYVGDLIVDIISPSGNKVNLVSKEGGDSANMVRTFTTAGPLSKMVNLQAKGEWRVDVSDAGQVDQGTLRAMTLNIMGHAIKI